MPTGCYVLAKDLGTPEPVTLQQSKVKVSKQQLSLTTTELLHYTKPFNQNCSYKIILTHSLLGIYAKQRLNT